METFLAELSPVVPALVGAVVGAILSACLTGFLVQRHWASRASESVLIDGHTKDLDTLVKMTLDYWSLDYSGETKRHKENGEKARALATKIKASIKLLVYALRDYSDRYCKNVDFTRLMSDVQDACTNGAFDAAKRGPDWDRYVIVVNATNRVRSALFVRRP